MVNDVFSNCILNFTYSNKTMRLAPNEWWTEAEAQTEVQKRYKMLVRFQMREILDDLMPGVRIVNSNNNDIKSFCFEHSSTQLGSWNKSTVKNIGIVKRWEYNTGKSN